MLSTIAILSLSFISVQLQAAVPSALPALTTESAVASPLPRSTTAIVVEDAWVRLMPPVSRMSAAYLTIKNKSGKAQTLLGCSSPDANSVTIHQTQDTGEGRLGMRHLDELVIPPGGQVSMEPGGLHIMLMGLKAATAQGQVIELQLEFDEAGKVNISAPVKVQ